MAPGEPSPELPEVGGESTVLIAGPPMSGKYELLLGLLGSLGDRSIVVSTEDGADRVRAEFESTAGPRPENGLGVVDCVSARNEAVTDTELTKYASAPDNLTAIGVKFTDLAESFRNRGFADVSVGFHSLSTLLMYFDVERVYRFLRVFNGQVEDSGWTGVATLGSTMHDERTLHTLYDPFGTVVETRVEADREYRVRSRDGVGDWTAF
jgi:hypothetical protein